MDFAAARKVMVDSQVRVNDVTDRALQAALMAAPRERLVPAERAFMAYAETTPEIAAGRFLMPARDIAKLLQAADPRADERALCLAAPYAALVLARMGLTVTAQEAEAAVFDVAGAALADDGVQTSVGALTAPVGEGWDLIVSEAAVPVRPDAWLAALREGGRLAVVERTGPVGKAVLYVKGRDGAASRKVLFDSTPPILAELTPEPTFAL
ncbi:MAG TPA: protein-L-isoaspartate O-methyltransferase [Brevundimonas sp.]|uniref:protein-L-isoaspartate O-methyltransferase family protein n=1 Tax=Brevundimonas sp. TaxID=1871086 RepID=UPI002613E267|nr:protein-L-isoaspartate O-methyltransferase [Brevundimonas sp.]HRO32284.1 protein-L-isoaspartate O-methyltransferase [Brevundimonas sp.]